MGFSNNHEIFRILEEETEQNKEVVESLPEKTKVIVRKYLTENDEEHLAKSRQSSMKFNQSRQKEDTEGEKELEVEGGEIKETKSVYESSRIEGQLMGNQSGAGKIEMFQENRESLKNEMDALFRLYEPEESEQKTIKRKV